MNYRESEEVKAALAAMAAEARGAEAPARVERQLVRAFRKRHAPVWRRPWAVAAAAALVAAVAMSIPHRTAAPVPVPAPRAVVLPDPVVVPVPAAVAAPKPKPTARRLARVRRPARPVLEQPEFIALPYAATAPPAAELWVARLRVSRAALAASGLPVNMDRADEAVMAEVAFAGDGTARAVRILK